MNGIGPAAVPGGVIADLKARETGGLIDLPKPPKFRAGDRLRSHVRPVRRATSVCTPE